jgi:hypothetical protein
MNFNFPLQNRGRYYNIIIPENATNFLKIFKFSCLRALKGVSRGKTGLFRHVFECNDEKRVAQRASLTQIRGLNRKKELDPGFSEPLSISLQE